MTKTRDHGGNLDAAIARYGGVASDWLDLSTGINPLPYPIPSLAARVWTDLPTQSDLVGLEIAAQAAYRTTARCIPFAGAQGVIQAVPYLSTGRRARVLGPTYNEHAAALDHAGYDVVQVSSLADLAGADVAVVVTPNNPDGSVHTGPDLQDLAGRVGLLVVDESFADPMPEPSVAPVLPDLPNVLVLRSFGKFYGLAGLRLGFGCAVGDLAERLAQIAGPWPVSGAAVAIGQMALTDTDWHRQTCKRLADDAERLDDLAQRADWGLVGGTPLFRTYTVPDASALQVRLAEQHIWTRIFPYSQIWIRFGLPGTDADWERLTAALAR